MLASLCYKALQLSGVTALARRLSSGGIVLCYHNVVADAAVGSPPLPPPSDTLGLHIPLSSFERQMRWLADNYEVVSLTDLVVRVSQGRSLRGVAAVTFDDGYRGVFDHAWPLLRDLNIPATVFVVAEAPARGERFSWDHPSVGPMPTERLPAPWETIAAAAASGLQVGVHSATHPSLPALDERDLHREVVASRDAIQRRTGVTAEFFAYPYGRWDDRVRRAVRSAGYRAAFALDVGDEAADLWAIPRVNVPAGIADAAFEAWTAGLNLRRRLAS